MRPDALKTEPEAAGIAPFHPSGYLRHWLVAGPRETLYKGPPGDENVLRTAALDHGLAAPPARGTAGGPGPFGEAWRYYYPGQNDFVEHSAFHRELVVLDSYAYVEVESGEETEREARLWACGLADLWVNDAAVARVEVWRYMFPDFQNVRLPLRAGVNRICVRLQCFGVRDTRTLFGLQCIDRAGLTVRVPGAARLFEAGNWLDGVRTQGRDAVAAPAPAPAGVSISGGLPWPEGSARVWLGDAPPFQFAVDVAAQGQTLRRAFEIPANRTGGAICIPADLRKARLEFIAGAPGAELPVPFRGGERRLLARRLLGRKSEADAGEIAAAVASVDRREDCADFALATLLRLESLGLATGDESARIQRAALAFRYWSDEPGNDAMCFWSENHSLLFHGCQWIAGQLYPDEVFSNSGRTGRLQAEMGAARCLEWLDRIEAGGFDEFNSSTYLPLTIGALLNVVDFGGNAQMARRASALIDALYADLAIHAFKGIVISPQGRVYRNVLYPEESGTQALLSDAASQAPPDFLAAPGRERREAGTGDWLVFQASSPAYRPPGDLDVRIAAPVSRRYRQRSVEIALHKTPDYLLTSLSVAPVNGVAADSALQPGRAGYQQHLWQATLGPECHVFVNHPGGTFDQSQSRPGYWYGNGILPRLRQREGIIESIFNIPDGSSVKTDRTPADKAWPPGGCADPFDLYPILFTHAHWPTDSFDREQRREHWLFGQKDTGFIGLWCSEPLTPHDDVLTGREFRAHGSRSAWVAICGGLAEHGSFDSFIEACLAREPAFDGSNLELTLKGEEPLDWGGARGQ